MRSLAAVLRDLADRIASLFDVGCDWWSDEEESDD